MLTKETVTRLRDVDAEEVVIGMALSRKESLSAAVLDYLESDDFSLSDTRLIFDAIKEMSLNGLTLFDEVNVARALNAKGKLKEAGGRARLISLQAKVPIPPPEATELKTYVDTLKEKTMRRRMMDAAQALQDAAGSPETAPTDGIARTAIALMDIEKGEAKGTKDASDVMQEAFESVINMFNGQSQEGSIKTGIDSLDSLLYAINPTDFVIIGARPAMGKTAFAENIMENVVLKQGIPVAFFSLEMSAEQIGIRMLLSQSGISSADVQAGNIGEGALAVLEATRDELAKAPFYIDDHAPMDITSIMSQARKLKAEKNIGLIIIDYIQLLTGNRTHDGRQQEVSDISRSLKILAKELDIPVIALSQLNRGVENRPDKRPQMSDLRETGSLEQDADIIMFLYRDDYYHPDTPDQGITEAIVAKHRNGKIGTARMHFDKGTTHFSDAGPAPSPPSVEQKDGLPNEEDSIPSAQPVSSMPAPVQIEVLSEN